MTEVKDNKTSLREINHKYGDPWIWGIYIMLIIVSIIENYTASSRNVATMGVYMPIIKHCIFLVGGGGLVFFIARIDYNKQWFLNLSIAGLALFTVFTLIWVMFFGEEINGAQRAIQLPGFSIQPAEIAKLSIVTLLAYILAKSQTGKDISQKGLICAGVAVAIYGGLMVKNGLTNFLLLISVCLSMLVIGGASFKKIVYLFGSLVVCGGLFYGLSHIGKENDKVLDDAERQVRIEQNLPENPADTIGEKKEASFGRSSTWVARVQRWWHSDSLVYEPITSKNQQEMFSRMAQANGGLLGVGVGQSRECSRLPLAFSDYIFSIIVEELGFVGGGLLLALYLSLLGRAMMIVRRSNRVLPSLLIIGMASLITFQALFHMAINVGLFPVSGQPLPLISNGGTSILVMSVAFGIMLSVSRTITINKNNNNNNIKEKEVELPAGLDAENPTQIVPRNVWR